MEQMLWFEKYRPKKISDVILPTSLKASFQQFVNTKKIPNLLLTGPAGVGKTTVARAMLEEIGADYLFINGSKDGNIDTLRTTIQQFASSVSFDSCRKYIILDEADYLNPNSTQPALRGVIEEFASNCGFILTCNYKNKIIEPLHSRMATISFDIAKADRLSLAKQMLVRVTAMLNSEKIEFDKQALAELVMKFFPDFRRTINELQRYSANGKIDSGILTSFRDVSLTGLIEHIKKQNFSEIRKWVAENSDTEQNDLFRRIYDIAKTAMTPPGMAQTVIILAKYMYQSSFCADPEINIMACLTEIMISAEFK